MIDPSWRTVADLAEELKVHKMTVYRLLTSGQLKGTKVGKLWRVTQADLDEYLGKGSNGDARYGEGSPGEG